MAARADPAAWVQASDISKLSDGLQDPAPFSERRREAFRLFQELALEPSPLYRQYGYFSGVDLTGIDAAIHAAPVPLPAVPADTLRVVHDASGTRVDLPSSLRDQGVRIRTLPEIWEEKNGALEAFLPPSEAPADRLSALGLALVNRGYRLELPPRLDSPVRVQDITILSQPHEALSVHRSISTGDDAQLLATEEVYSTSTPADGQRLFASSVSIDVGARAKVVFVSTHAPDRETVSLYQRRASSGPASRLAWIWAGLGGHTTKVRNRTALLGTGCSVNDLQSFYGDRKQSYDSAIELTHIGTETHGVSITRGVFKDEARGMSRGLVRIERDARKTLSFISEHAMLLTRGARSDTIPVLEILCPDVKATHSTSVAPVDPEKIFYLESRGIAPSDSVRIIGEGFLSYVMERAPIAGLRDILSSRFSTRWEGGEATWSPERYPVLPPLEVTGTEAAPEWRFDSKLR